MFINKIYLEMCLKYITFVVGKPGARDSVIISVVRKQTQKKMWRLIASHHTFIQT